MTSTHALTFTSLTRVLRASMLMFCTTPVWALTPVDQEETIGPTDPLDSYEVNAGGRLNATGASTLGISINPGGELNMQSSTVDGGRAEGVATTASTAFIADSSVRSNTTALRLLRRDAAGSTVTVNGSQITGGAGGASLSAHSTLSLQNSTLVGTGTSAAALLFGSSTLNAQGSTMIGASDGLQVFVDTAFPEATRINLVDTHVEGLDGAAILVGNPFLGQAQADILVGPGATLKGSDGTLLEVVNDSTANFTADGAQLNGDISAELGSSATVTLTNQAHLAGRLQNVDSLTLANQGRWTLIEDSQIGKLNMSAGEVRFGEANQYQRLTLGELSGSGTFIMDTNFATGETDVLDVTGTATGNHGLLVGSSGAEPTTSEAVQLVHAGGGDATFALLGGPVDVGTFSYALVQRGSDWFLEGVSDTISPGTASALVLFNTAPTVWYGELATLRGRLGELRLDPRRTGAWGRAYGNQYNVDGQAGYRQTQQGFSLGADTPLPWGDGQWMAGVLAGHSNSDLNLTRGGSAEVKSYYLGVYATWLSASSGYYLDSMVKLNRFDNDSEVTLSDGQRAKGSYDNIGVGASVEFGRHLSLGNGYFVEPYTQWSAATIAGKDYRLDNGLEVRGDDTRSLLGKAGATLGRTFDLGAGRFVQPYLRLAYAHEFADNNQVKVNDTRFDNDLAGSRAEAGAGVSVALDERLQLHADFDYSHGERIEQPWGANVGLSYRW
ncbi:autotransporter outer membrane beta-barrel domain-containing protein [Pseudomonas entomophila]|uniref:autotransporter outer membrane beta-barrel domain-containing protein n=1 Tax=Pseudomonas entomophila TaxID=312306 RepID=UPI0015E46898|nr:autotransporter outer membrane beta-barrel domain-containing protein [Pseudomonas entomophila]MBA1187471.1 autotransporter outer membrane beta-barrel domain-containing protein [Pseudomonas entomophila]